MTKNQYNIRLTKEIATKWKQQALNLNISDSAYIEALLTKIFDDGILLFDKKEVFGYKKMIETNEEDKFRLKKLSVIEKEVNEFIIKTILSTTAEWNSPMMNYRLKLSKDYIDNQLSIANKLNSEKVLLDKLIELKDTLNEKNEEVFLNKIMNERAVKFTLYWLSKKYRLDYHKLDNYVFGKSKSLVKVHINSTVEEV